MELRFANRLWDRAKVEGLLYGIQVPDSDSDDGWADVPLQSWYQLRCAAYDKGDVNAVHDAIQFEDSINMVSDGKVRAALVLAMWGWDMADIGAAIGGYRTGDQLVKAGVKAIVSIERRRSELA